MPDHTINHHLAYKHKKAEIEEKWRYTSRLIILSIKKKAMLSTG